MVNDARSSLTQVGWLVPLLLSLACGSSPTDSTPTGWTPTDGNPTNPSPAGPDPVSVDPSPAVDPGSFRPVAGGPVPADVLAAGHEGLQRLRDVGLGAGKLCGFPTSGSVDAAELGAPVAVYHFTSLGHLPGTPEVPTPYEWRFPVTADGSARCTLWADWVDGRWQVIGFVGAGGAPLVQAPETIQPSVASGSRGIVEMLHHAMCSPVPFLGVDLEQAKPSFVPLPPATELVRRLPKYAAWTSADPVPVLSWEELSAIWLDGQTH